MSRFLPPRLMTAAALVAAIVAASVAPTPLKLAMIGLVLLLCWREWLRMAGVSGAWARSAGILLFALVLAAPVAIPLPEAVSYAFLVLAVVWWVLAIVLLRGSFSSMSNPAALACGFLGMAPAWLAVLAILDSGRADLLILLLILVGAADTGAFAVGKLMGRRPLAPVLSGGKTIEGAVGGLILATLAGFGASFFLQQSALFWTLGGLAVGGLSMLGDLTVSMFKRRAGIKDSGRMLPGHGGMLDRMDSSIATAPLMGLLMFQPVGWLPLQAVIEAAVLVA